MTAIGVDIGGTKILGVVVGDDRSIVDERRRPTPAGGVAILEIARKT